MKFQSFFLALLSTILFQSPAQAQETCQIAFGGNNRTPASEYPERMFARGEGAKLETTYFENMKFVASAFEAWIDGLVATTPPHPRAVQEEMSGELQFLSAQHRAVVYGDGQHGVYWPGLRLEADALAGTYRSWVQTPKYNDPLEHHHQPSPLVRAEIERMRGPQARLTTMTSGIPQVRFKVSINDIDSAAAPTYRFDGSKIVYFYPAPSRVPEYLGAMGQALAETRSRLHQRQSRDAVLQSLARYYHLAMIGHPFVRANNSLVMAQVNVILRRLGMKEVVHGELDYIVRSLDSQQAEAYFVSYVKSLQ
jgi:hypothetical protein